VPSPALPPSTPLLQETTLHLLRKAEQTQDDFFFQALQKERVLLSCLQQPLTEGFGPDLQSRCGPRTSLKICSLRFGKGDVPPQKECKRQEGRPLAETRAGADLTLSILIAAEVVVQSRAWAWAHAWK